MPTEKDILAALAAIPGPDGRAPLTAAVAGLTLRDGKVYLALKADHARAQAMEPLRAAAEAAIRAVPGVLGAMVTLTADRPGSPAAPSSTPAGPRATAARAGQPIAGIARIIAVASGASTMPPERREYVRVPAHVPLTIPESSVHHGRATHVETEDLSGGGLSFRSKAPPRLGSKIDLLLELGDHELSMHGEVVRIAPSQKPADPAIVGVAFRDIETATREEVVKWIAAEEIREIAAQRRGPVCALCGLPLAEPNATTHPSCATAAATSQPPRISAAPPSGSATRAQQAR